MKRLLCIVLALSPAICGTSAVAEDLVLRAADGRLVGTLVQLRFQPVSFGDPRFGELQQLARVLTPEGYLVDIALETGVATATIALGPGILGTVYASEDCTGLPLGPLRPGLTVDFVGALFHVPRDALPVSTEYRSGEAEIGLGSGCVLADGTIESYPLNGNDPGTTGIPAGGHAAPITFFVWRERIFESGFERLTLSLP